MVEAYKRAAQVVPSERQLKWQKLEFYAFCHFGMNTFTGKEWGDGTASPELFNPTDFDAEQWVRAIKNGGMSALILTCKHHDGFCLWPSAYTDYSVKTSPFRDGKGDVVREVSDACRKYGLKFGIYLSPWDRHEPSYGKGDEYNEYYKNQLRELLTNYGDIFCIWLDGACGEGKNGKVQQYDWQGFYKVMRELRPGATINICGPDVRWVGNEAGVGRESEWSVVPSYYSINEFTAEKSQKEDNKKFRKSQSQMIMDMGSRKAIKDADELIWYPSEVDVSIRPGWFFHESENYKQKSIKKLMNIYLSSVGNNSTLLLNIPPDKTGRIYETDALLLENFKHALDRRFPKDLLADATVTASSNSESAKNIISTDDTLYWQADGNDQAPEIVFEFSEKTEFDSLVLQENIATGQQIEKFSVYIESFLGWRKISKKTVVGYKKIICFKRPKKTKKIKIKIDSYRVKCTLLKVEAYNSK